MDLSQRQAEALEVIRALIEEQGFSPSMREIAKRMKIHISVARRHVLALEEKRVITRVEGTPRSIQIRPFGEEGRKENR